MNDNRFDSCEPPPQRITGIRVSAETLQLVLPPEKISELQSAELIIDRVYELNWQLNLLKKQYDAKVAELRGFLREVRKECKHDYIETFPDASGNNDRTEQCKVCGEYLR